MDKGYENNRARMAGTIVGEVALDHTLYGEAFYLTHLAVPRLSGVVDVLPLIAPGRLFDELPQEGDTVEVEGQVRSYNKRTAQGSRLMVTLFARSFLPVVPDALAPHNEVSLCGYLCKPANFRTTPFSREIADLLLAVNRSYHKSDYLPCIAWGRNARFAQSLSVGERVCLTGRLQSRAYQKCYEDGTVAERTTYEISCSSLEPIP